MKTYFHRGFNKQLGRLPLKIREAFVQRLNIFINNPHDPILNLHKLKGSLIGRHSLNITGDYRAVISLTEELAVFHKIGTHGELYKK